MKLLFTVVLFLLIEFGFSAKDRGRYFELDNIPKVAYLFTDNDCNKFYICKNKVTDIFALGVDISGCYYRNEKINELFGPASRKDPDQCIFKGRVELTAGKYYYTNIGNEVAIDNFNGHPNARYYDIDFENKRALTEFGVILILKTVKLDGWKKYRITHV